jgi:hypothetical protein
MELDPLEKLIESLGAGDKKLHAELIRQCQALKNDLSERRQVIAKDIQKMQVVEGLLEDRLTLLFKSCPVLFEAYDNLMKEYEKMKYIEYLNSLDVDSLPRA